MSTWPATKSSLILINTSMCILHFQCKRVPCLVGSCLKSALFPAKDFSMVRLTVITQCEVSCSLPVP